MFDAQGHHPENFYHGLVLGLMAGLRDTHIVRSNSESGLGRYDIALIPRSGALLPGIVMEFKQTPRVKGLQAAAKAALSQIDTRSYGTELRQHKIGKIIFVGLAFSGKRVACAFAERTSATGAPRKRSRK